MSFQAFQASLLISARDGRTADDQMKALIDTWGLQRVLLVMVDACLLKEQDTWVATENRTMSGQWRAVATEIGKAYDAIKAGKGFP